MIRGRGRISATAFEGQFEYGFLAVGDPYVTSKDPHLLDGPDPSIARFGMKLADDECQHGRLPGDSTPACGCWPDESVAVRRFDDLSTPDPIGAYKQRRRDRRRVAAEQRERERSAA